MPIDPQTKNLALQHITDCTAHLMRTDDRFYGEIFYRLRRVADEKCMSMGVSMQNGGTLVYNPQFVLDNLPNLKQVLIHEAIHIIAGHIFRGQLQHLNHKFVNVCADFATNSVIRDMPDTLKFRDADGALKDGHLYTIPNYAKEYPDLQGDMPFEYYVQYFKDKNDGAPEDGAGDDHSSWDDLTPEQREQAVKRLVEAAVEGTKQAGKQVPEAMRPLISDLMNSEIPWEQVLRRFPDTVQTRKTEPTRMRRNRRYGTVFPGQKPVRTSSIAVLFDVSGSITDEIVTKFDNCLREIHEQGVDITILFFDDKVYPDVKYTPGCFDDKIPGGGGTMMGAALDRANELGVDGIIILTDGQIFDGKSLTKPAYPVVQGVLEGYTTLVPWGHVCVIK